MTGWFILALREAVVLTDRYRSAPEAMRYYARLAAEVNAACAAGLLRCGPLRSSLAPPWRRAYLGLTLRRLCRVATRLITLADRPIVGVCAVASLVLCLSLGRARRTCRLLGPALVLLIAIGARLALLAYMDATAFPFALNPSYMLPLYPLMLAFFLLACIDGLHVLPSVRWLSAHR